MDLSESIHDKIAEDIEPFGGFLRCEVCNRKEALSQVAGYLAHGWPSCCGYTMRWWTQRQIDAGEVPPPTRFMRGKEAS